MIRSTEYSYMMSPCDVTIVKVDIEVSVNAVLGLISQGRVAPRFM
jgi:hypothetical protein